MGTVDSKTNWWESYTPGQVDYGYAQDDAATARERARAADTERYGYNQGVDQSRGEQGSALGLLRGAAEGTAPSRAEMFGRQQMDQAASGQQSLAASARGPAALAMAQQQAAGNTARAQTDITNSSMQMRADEMARARDLYMGGASAMRGQDQARVDAASNRQLGMMGQATANNGLSMQGQQWNEQNGLNAFQQNQQAKAAWIAHSDALDQRKRDQMNATAGTVMSTAGAVAGMMSDVRTKENVRGINPNAMEEYLATLTPASYQYNGVGGTPAASQQVGPASAQAIAGTQVGQSVVEQRPDGLLSISAPGAIKAGMAADAHINDKASRAEAKADAALRMQANQYADPMTAALMGMGPKKADGPGLASLTTAPTVVSAQPKRDWLMDELARINATNNVKGPR